MQASWSDELIYVRYAMHLQKERATTRLGSFFKMAKTRDIDR